CDERFSWAHQSLTRVLVSCDLLTISPCEPTLDRTDAVELLGETLAVELGHALVGHHEIEDLDALPLVPIVAIEQLVLKVQAVLTLTGVLRNDCLARAPGNIAAGCEVPVPALILAVVTRLRCSRGDEVPA